MFFQKMQKRVGFLIVQIFFLFMVIGCVAASESDSQTAAPGTDASTNDVSGEGATEELTISPERFGFAIVTVPGGEKRWPMAESIAEAVLDWSPDGRSILYSSSANGNSDLFTLDLETGEAVQLTGEEWLESDGRFSPDGAQIAYLSLTNLAQYQHHLFIVNRDGSNPRQLAATEGNTAPRWSPDGSKIAYEHEQNLMLFDLVNDSNMQLADLAGEQQIVDWSTDGEALLFTSNHHRPQDAQFRLYQYSLLTGDVEPLAQEMENVAYADLSPDGRFITFTSNANSNHVDIYHLYLLDRQNGAITQLGEREAAHVAWSPGGDWITFSSYEANRDIFIIRPDGSELTRLTDSGEDEWGSIWSPDGTQIAFLSERFSEQASQTSPQTVVPQANFTRIDLRNDLRPRGLSDLWYVASEMAGGTLYLIEIESGRRFVISENGGWGDVVVTQTTVAWIDDDGHVQQYNIVTRETQQVTREPAERFNLVGNDQWLVWQDKRNETGDENTYTADIYAFNLFSGEEIPVAVAEGVQQQPVLSGETVVWADNRNSPVRGEPLEGCGNCPDNPFDIYSYNLQTGETAVLVADGKHNAQPTIERNQMAWITFGEGIQVMDLQTGAVETAVPYQQGMAQPYLFANQLRYAIKQACDVIMLDEIGQEIPANTGAFLFDLASRETIQLTGYKEPLVLHNRANVVIGEGCMTGFETVYLLQDLHPQAAVSPVQGPAVISHDPDLVVTDWEYSIPEFPPALENVRVLDELHYEIRLAETAVGFDLIWSNYLCSTQPVLFIQPGHQLELWPGNIVGESCESMSVGHMFSVSLDQNVPLDDWQFIFHAPPGEQ